MEEGQFFPYHSLNKIQRIEPDGINVIYRKLGDEESRQIFIDRLLFSMTYEWQFINHLLKISGNYTKLNDVLTRKENISAYIYGAGIRGKNLLDIFPEYNWVGYIDRSKQIGGVYNDIPVYGIEECSKISDKDVIIVSNASESEKIIQELMDRGICKDNILSYEENIRELSKYIYFEDFCIDKQRLKGKAFVDVGAYKGEDSIRYYKWINNLNAKIIAFESDLNNYEICKLNLTKYKNIKLYNMGLSNKSGEQNFVSGKGKMSVFSEMGDIAVPMTCLDEVANTMEIGYIKMDIEGFEKQALLGARRIIKQQYPMLAVSIYHKREDIWEIPKIILELNPKYKFFLRHYSLRQVDTVLYAV